MATKKRTPAAGEAQVVERNFVIQPEPMRKVLSDQQRMLDSEVLISADPMSSKYPKIVKTLEEWIKKKFGQDVVIGLFNYDDLRRVHGLGYRVMSTDNFDSKVWSDTMAMQLGVTVDAANALRVDNKYVCFILRELRDKRLVAEWEKSSEKLAAGARRQAGQHKPFTKTKPGEMGAEFEDAEETIRRPTRKQVEQPDEADAPE